ncbi:MAG: carboxypeptidase-like regulatory domain-containing protein [Oscillospiraceae bacterium]|nr:carboxypeptidase-like regulatory domain-containing protein [Oscillospiraceae bacterium]
MCNYSGTFTMKGGTISGNTAGTGGGVYNYRTFEMEDGTISGNTASQGGGVYTVGGTSYTFEATGGSIINNTATTDGGGIWTGDTVNYANLTIGSSVFFSGNSAAVSYEPMPNADARFPNIEYASISIYNHPLTNFDINRSLYVITIQCVDTSGNTVGVANQTYTVVNGNTFTLAASEIPTVAGMELIDWSLDGGTTLQGNTSPTITNVNSTYTMTLVYESTIGALSGTATMTGGTALPGATITLSQSGVDLYTTTTSADGTYSFAEVEAGTYDITASYGAFTDLTDTVTIVKNQTAVKDFEFPLPAGMGAFQVIVKAEATGELLSGATVVLGGTAYTTDADGEALIVPVAYGTYNILAAKTGYNAKTVSGTLSSSVIQTVEIALSEGTNGAIYGMVDDGTNALAGAAVQTLTGHAATTDSTGFYAITDVAAGSYAVVASMAGYNSAYAGVTVEASRASEQNFTLTQNTTGGGTAADAYIITGQVTDERTGSPIAGAAVTDGTATVTTDAYGYYAIGGYPAGSVGLTASATGYGNASGQVTITAQDEVYNFALSSGVAITVKGMAGTAELYSYSVTAFVDETIDPLTAWTMPTYVYTRYTVTDADGGSTTGTTNSVSVSPADGAQTVTFHYRSLTTTVTVRACLDGSTTAVPGFTAFTVPAVEGDSFTYTAPAIQGYQNTGVNAALPITVAASGASEIIFYYKAHTGNLEIQAVDADTGAVIGYMGKTLSTGGSFTASDANAPTASDIPALAYYTLVAGSGDPASVTYDGVSSTGVVTYEYTRNTAGIRLTAYNSLTNQPIAGETPVEKTGLPVLQEYDYTADIVAISGYTLDAASSRKTIVPATGTGDVIVYYTPVASSQIPVEIRVDSATGALLQSYTILGAVGQTVTATVPAIAGYVHDAANADNILTITYDGTNKLVIIMTDVRVSVTTMTQLGTSTASVYGTPEFVVSGTSVTAYAPYIGGYVLKGYTIDGGTEVTTGTLDVVALGAVTADTTVTFRYESVQSNLDAYTSVITVRGVEGTTTHYEYALTVANDAAPFAVTAQTLANLKVTDAALDGASQGAVTAVTVDPAGGSQTVVFTYADNTAAVTVRAYYDGTTTPVESFTAYTVTAEIGKAFSVTAPAITGFTCVNPTANTLTSVTGMNDEIIFYYTKDVASSGLVINAVDQDGGALLGTVYRAISNGATFTPDNTNDPKTLGELPVLANYTYVSAAPASVTYNGVSDVTVTYTYQKIQRNIVVEAWDSQAGAKIGEIAAAAYDVGQVHAISAPTSTDIAALSDYTLNTAISDATQNVYLDNASAADVTVKFFYTPNAPGAVTVKAYWMDGTTQTEIQSYTTSYPAGIAVSVSAPVLHGWTLDDTATKTVTPSAGATTEVAFKYVKDVSVITVTLMAGTTQLTAPTDYAVTIEVPTGDSYAITAPYVNGYVLADGETGSRTGTATGSAIAVTFQYQQISDLYVTHSIRGVEVDDQNAEVREFYSYSFSAVKGTGDTAYAAAAVPGYYIVGGVATCDLSNAADGSYTFQYMPSVESVTVKAVDDASNVLYTRTEQGVTIGQTYGSVAPHVDGYSLNDSLYKTITVSDSSANEIVFHYVQSGNVRLLLKETGGGTIQEITVDSAATYTAAPALDYYTYDDATTQSGGVTFPLVISDVATPADYEIYYTKDTRNIVIRAVDDSNTPIAADRTDTGRIGEMYTATAENIQGYTLDESPTKLVYVDDATTDLVITFIYKQDETADVKVTAYYMDGGSEVVLRQYSFKGIVDSKVKASAFSDLSGWTLTTGEDTEKEITVASAGNEIKFEYTMKTVDITIAVQDAAGTDLSSKVPAGYDLARTVQAEVETVISAPAISGYILQGPNYSYTGPYTDAQVLTFVYKSISDVVGENTAKITVKGVYGGAEQYSYTLTVATDTAAFTVSAQALANLAVTGAALDSTDLGAVTAVTVDPANGDQSVVFTYGDNTTTVTIKAYYTGTTTPVETFTEFKVPAEIGKSFTYDAPSIAGFNNTGSSTTPITVSATAAANEMIFYYTKASGHLTVIAAENGTEIGRYVRDIAAGTAVDTTDANAPTTTEIPAISNYTLVAGSGSATATTYDGVTDVTLTYEYARDRVNVTLTAYDSVTGAAISGGVVDQSDDTGLSARVGENFDYSGYLSLLDAKVAATYTRELTASTLIVVSATASDNVVKVYYQPAKSGSVTANVYDQATDVLLMTYPVAAATGETVTVNPATIAIAGYSYVSDAREVLSAAEGSGNVIKVYMQDVRKTVTVNITKDTVASGTETYKVVAGTTNYKVYPAYLSGYVLMSYDFNGTNYTSGLDEINLGTIDADTSLTLNYKSLSGVISDSYFTVTVTGKDADTGATLYSYPLTLAKGTGNTTVSALTLNGYEFNTGETGTASIPLDGTTTSVEFLYKTLKRTVTIVAEDQSGTALMTAQTVTGQVGETLTINAPVITDYERVTAADVVKTHTVDTDATNNTVTFVYKKAAGNLLFQYVSETDGSVIVQTSETVTVGTSTTGLAPSAAVTLPTGWALKNGTGEPAANEATVGTNTVVTYTLVKDMKTITVNYYAAGTTTAVATATTQQAQNGTSNVTVLAAPADLQSGYVLVGDPYQTVAQVSGDTAVSFYYQMKTATGAGAITIIGLDASGSAIYYNVGSQITVGTAYTSSDTAAPSMLGWKNPVLQAGSDPTSGVMTELGVTVIYKYEMDTVDIPVYVTDASGNALTGITNSGTTAYTTQTVQVGGDVTIYAPHLDSYEVTSASSVAITNADAAAALAGVTFKYRSTSTADTVYVECIDTTMGTSDNVIRSWTQKGDIGNSFTISAPTITNYQLVSGEATAQTGTYGTDSAVTFRYEPLTVSVTIYAEDTSGNDVTGYTPVIVTGVRVGMEYKAAAPVISGYEIADGNYERAITSVSSTDNAITFIYKKAAGNILVMAVEAGNTTNVLGAWTDTANVGDTYTATAQAFTGWTAGAVTPITVVSGQNEISIEYSKQTADVTVKAVLDGAGTVLGSSTVTGVQVGTQYTAGMLFVAGYELKAGEASAKSVNVAAGTNEISFTYVQSTANVFVLHKDAATGAVLAMTTDSAAVGADYTAYAMSIDGYVLSGADEQTATVGSGTLVLEFAYDQNMGVVTVELIDSTGGLVITSYQEAVQYDKDTNIYAPQLGGYVLDDSAYKSVNVPNGTTTTVQFQYKSYANIIAGNYAGITIKGVYNGAEQYSYTLTVARDAAAFDVTAQALANLAVTGAALDGTSLGAVTAVTVDPANGDQSVVFTYGDNTTTVTIKAYYTGTTTPVEAFTEFKVPAEIGKAFSYDAPSIAGFNNTGNSGTPITVSATASANEIIFYYTRANGNLTVIATENGTEIGRYVRMIAIGAVDTTDANAPTATEIPATSNYTLVTGSGSATAASYDGVTDVTLTYAYTRQTATVTLVAYDRLTGTEISGNTVTVSGARILENYDYAGDIVQSITGYTLLPQSSTIILVDANSANNVVKIYYEPDKTGSIPVEVRTGSATGEILYSYSIYAANGETVTFTTSEVPSIAGYSFNAAASVMSATEGSGSKIILVMNDDRYTITVYTTKDAGAPVLHDTVKVIPGNGVNIYAPYISGYQLESYVKDNGATIDVTSGFTELGFSSLASDHEVIFNYITATYQNNQSTVPTVDPIEDGDSTISGTGEPDAEVTVTLPDGTEIDTTVDQNGNWSVDIPNGTDLNDGDEITVIQTENGKDPSDEVVVEVGNSTTAGTGSITVTVTASSTGSVLSGATVKATYNGTTATYTTDSSGVAAITGAELGDYSVTASYSGYTSKTASVTLTQAAQDQSVDMALAKSSSGGGGGSSSSSSATLLVRGIDKASGKVIYEDSTSATVGQSKTVAAPSIDGYALDSESESSQTITIKSGTNTVTFNYNNVSEDSDSTDADSNTGADTGTETGVLEMDEHIDYIDGYADGTVRPDNNISRAEVAAIFFKLLKDSGKNVAAASSFTDVAADKWYAQSVNYLASIGVLDGYADGTFRPEQTITRAEFAAIASRFDKLEASESVVFSDVSADHWAEGYINSAYVKGWVTGFADGTFRPDESITRAQTVTIIDNVLDRKIQKENIPEELYGTYSDLMEEHWAFEAIMEASVAHDYERQSDGTELWK